MEILEKLDIKVEKGSYISLVSTAMSGKTSILVMITEDLLLKGKKVLYISDELLLKDLVQKFKNVKECDKLVLKNTNLNLINHFIQKHVKNEEYDVIILDGFFGNKINYKDLASEKKISIINSKQVRKESRNEIFSDFSKPMQSSDCYICFERNNTISELSILDKVKNTLLFWKSKKVKGTNFIFNILKNRYGKTGQVNLIIDLEKLYKK